MPKVAKFLIRSSAVNHQTGLFYLLFYLFSIIVLFFSLLWEPGNPARFFVSTQMTPLCLSMEKKRV